MVEAMKLILCSISNVSVIICNLGTYVSAQTVDSV